MPETAWDVRRFESLPSTNSYLLGRARAGGPEGLVAVAEFQTAGRGRLGRPWLSPKGASLLASVLLRPTLATSDLFLCQVIVALAATDACTAVAHVSPLFKWPNDLVVGGKKLAGVLTETDSPPGSGAISGNPPASPVVVGIGLNLEWDGPEDAGGTALRTLTGRSVDRDVLLASLLEHLGHRRRALDDEGGRRRIREELVDRCTTLGQRVRVQTPGEIFEGIAVSLTGQGHLEVRTRSGTRAVAAGDVVHLRPA